MVNQLTVQGGSADAPGNTRRADLVVYVNGLPLVVFELKNPGTNTPTSTARTISSATTPSTSRSCSTSTRSASSRTASPRCTACTAAGFEWYAPWKSIDGFTVEPNTTGSMKTLVEGLFPKDRLLDYVRNFIVFEVVNDKITKKGRQVPPVLRGASRRGQRTA